MKKISNYLLASCALLSFSCSSGGDDPEPEPIPPVQNHYVSFQASLSPMSRATDTHFDTMDEIGIFAVRAYPSDDFGYIEDDGNYADNVKYTYSNGKFTSKNAIEIEDDGDKFYYHAVYPYVYDAGPKFYFDVKTNQQGENYTLSDLCTANSGATSSTMVHLSFGHRLSKVVIKLEGDNWPSGEMSFKINDVKTNAKIDLNRQDFSSSNRLGEVTCANNGTKSFKVILPPQTLEETDNFGVLTINGTEYQAPLQQNYDLQSGQQCELTYTYNSSKELVEFTGDILPWNDVDERLNDVVPEDIRKKMEKYIPIYNGVTPPNVEGVYFSDPFVTVYCEDQESGGYDPGEIVQSVYIRFSNQRPATNQVDFEQRNEDGTSFEIGKGAFISGSGQNFTAFFNTEGESDGIWTKTALVISGSKTSSGIENLKYAFVMVDKGDDPEQDLMDVGIFRVFEDQDKLAENSSWPAYVKKAHPLYVKKTFSFYTSKHP